MVEKETNYKAHYKGKNEKGNADLKQYIEVRFGQAKTDAGKIKG